MPYSLSADGKCVLKRDTGEKLKCYDNTADAHAYLSALNIAYAREHGHNIPEKSATKETPMNRLQEWLSSAFKQAKQPEDEKAEDKPDDEKQEDAQKEQGGHLVTDEQGKKHLPTRTGGKPDHGLMGAAWASLTSNHRGNSYEGPNKAEALAKLRKMYEAENMQPPSGDHSATKAVISDLSIVKQADGHYRWMATTTSAFRDRDRQLITSDALKADTERMNATKQFGDLGWWHVELSPNDPQTRNPGVGVSLASCDASAWLEEAHSRIETGVYHDDAVGEAMLAHQKELGTSIDFWYSASEPDAQGNFNKIETYRRCLLPQEHASNLMAMGNLAVHKEMKSMDDKLDALKKLVGDAPFESAVKSAKEKADALLRFGVEKKEFDPALIESKVKELTATFITKDDLMQALKDYHEAFTKSQSKERDELKTTVADLNQKVTTLWGDAPKPLTQEVHNAPAKQTTLAEMESLVKEKQGQPNTDAEPLGAFAQFAFGKNGN